MKQQQKCRIKHRGQKFEWETKDISKQTVWKRLIKARLQYVWTEGEDTRRQTLQEGAVLVLHALQRIRVSQQVTSGRQWRTEEPGGLQSVGSQRVRHD